MVDDNSGSQSGQIPPHHQQQPPPPPGYGYPQQPYRPVAPKHPQAVTAMVLGIIGIAACGLVAPFAWVIGARSVNEIDASGGAYSGRSEANAGKIMGIVGSVLMIVAVLALAALLVVGLAVGSSDAEQYTISGAL